MRVFNYSTWADTAGQAIRMKQAFDRLTDPAEWQYDSLAIWTNYIKYPEDHGGSLLQRRLAAEKLYKAADVVHLNNTLDGWQDQDQISGARLCKPVIFHHHGTTYRDKPHETSKGARAIGAVEIASTFDLTLYEPDVEWLPAPYDLAMLAAIAQDEYQPSDRIRVVHAPTNRTIKGTAAVLETMAQLADELPIDFDLVERTSWRECLSRVARADIVLDQFSLGYGCLAIESWGMGKVVVGGVEDPAIRKAMANRWGGMPMVEATPETIGKVVRRLVKSKAARDEAREVGMAHVVKYHDDAKVIARLQEIYRAAPPTRYPVSTWRGVKPWKKSA